VYSKADPEDVYGAVQLMNRLGLPYGLIRDLSKLNRKEKSSVLVIPESARINVEEERVLLNSNLSIMSIGYIPRQSICEDMGFKLVGSRKVQLPFSYGTIRMLDGLEVPFYYDFSIIEIVDNSFKLIGKIYLKSEEYPGIMVRSFNRNKKVFILANLLRSVTYLFSGAEESQLKSREFFDEYERIDDRIIRRLRKEFFKMPIVEIYQEILIKLFMDICSGNNTPIVQKWFHPFNHKIALCLTHDIDIVSYMPLLLALKSFYVKKNIKEGIIRLFLAFVHYGSTFIFRMHLSERRDTYSLLPQQIVQSLLPYNPYWNFDEFDQIEREFKANNSTYYFQTGLSRKTFEGLFNSIEIDYSIDSIQIRRVIKTLRQRGYEIGLHGSILSFKNAKEMRSEKFKLINTIGTQHIGIRQHRWLMKVPETWKLHAEEGFIYDSSYGYAHDVGFRAGTGFPFNPWDIEKRMELPILEIPPIIQDGILFLENLLNYSAEEAFKICKGIIDTINRYNGIITLLWHPHINREKKKYWMDSYRDILRYASRYDPWFTNALGLAEWWNLRNKVKFGEFKVSRTSIKFLLHSPIAYKGFSVKMLSPFNISRCEVFINGQSLESNQVEKHENCLLFTFDISEGLNEVRMKYM